MGGEVSDRLELPGLAGLDRLQPSKAPGVAKVDHLVVVQVEARPAVGLSHSAAPADELAGHAQMGEQALVFELKQQIFALPGGIHQFSPKRLERLAIGAAKCPRLLRVGRDDAAAGEPSLE